MAKQKQIAESSEAALSAIEHALGLYGSSAAKPGEDAQAQTSVPATNTPKEGEREEPRLPRVEDAPLLSNPPQLKTNSPQEEALDAHIHSETMPTVPPTPQKPAPQKDENTEPSHPSTSQMTVQADDEPQITSETTPFKLPQQRDANMRKIRDRNKEESVFAASREDKEQDERRSNIAPNYPSSRQPDRPSDEAGEQRRTSVLPANDDTRSSVAEMLEPLSRRASRVPDVLAVIASLLWAGGAWVILSQNDGLLFASNGSFRYGLLGSVITASLGILAPILFFFSLASIAKRTRDMRVSAQVMAEVAARLAEPEVNASEAVFTLGQAVRREVTSIGDGIERALSRAGDLESLVHGEVAALERSYAENEYKMRSLVGELSAEREAIMATAERIRQTIDAAHQGFTLDIDKASSNISEAINEAGDRVTFLIGGKQDEIVITLDKSASHAAELIGIRTQELAEKMNMASQDATNSLLRAGDDAITRLTSTFDEKGQTIITNIATRAVEINQVVQNSGSELFKTIEARGEEVAQIIEGKVAPLVEGITNQAFIITEKFEASAYKIDESMGEGMSRLSGLMDQNNAVFANTLSERITQAHEALSITGDNLGALINTKTEEASAQLASSGREVLDAILEQSNRVNEALVSNAGQFAASIDNIGALFDTKTEEASAQLASSGQELLNNILEQGNRVNEALASNAGQLAASIDNIGALLDTRTEEASAQLASSGRELLDNILEQGNRVNEALASNAGQLATSIQNGAEEVGRQFSIYESSFVEKTRSLEQNVLLHGEALGQKLVDQADSVSATIGSLLNRIETGLDDRAKSLGDVLALRTLELSRLITESSGRLENVTIQSRETAEEAIQRAENLARAVTEKVTEINTLFDENGMRFITSLEGHGRDLLMGMENSVGAITTRLTVSMAELNEAVERGSSASLTQLSEANDQLRDEVTTLLGRLGEANTLLGSIIGTTTQQLGDVEGRMSERVEQLERALASILAAADQGSGAVLEKIEAIKNGTDQMFNASGELSNMLGSRTTELQNLAHQLNETQNSVGARLTERQEAFENLARTLNSRIEDVDSMLRSFASLVTEQLDQAQKQARETSSIVLEASESAASTISTQYERVRQEAGKERERTATALRQTYEQANGEMSTLLKRALDEFSITASEVREASADIIRDIEITRRALAEGGMDIPQQAKLATASLKRVVQDQMRAVSELGEIATRSGSALDVAEPRNDDSRRGGARLDEPRAVERAPHNSQRRGSSSYVAEPATYAQEPPRAPLYTPEPPPAPRYDTRPPAPTRNDAQRGGPGWLSGMLERAADEDRAPLSPLRNTGRAAEPLSGNRMEALDSLSVDIARMIDHDMAVDLWDRYRRGERNVFTRRLYTLQGQDTYDEIRRRYRRDNDFRQTVDAYILQFERLLGEVSGNDRDSSISRSYLTSETGKVYTMLAHAAGRFD